MLITVIPMVTLDAESLHTIWFPSSCDVCGYATVISLITAVETDATVESLLDVVKALCKCCKPFSCLVQSFLFIIPILELKVHGRYSHYDPGTEAVEKDRN
jgi:hypothetical protein